MNLYRKNTQQRPFQSNFRYQSFPQTARIPEAPYSGIHRNRKHYGAAEKQEVSAGASAGIGMLLGVGFLIYVAYSFTQLHEELKEAQSK